MVPCSNNIMVPNIMVPWKFTLTGRVFLDRETFKVGYNFFKGELYLFQFKRYKFLLKQFLQKTVKVLNINRIFLIFKNYGLIHTC
jgi:hypothetical protein